MIADGALCRTLTRADIPCDYNARTALVHFLEVNGEQLFVPGDGTNPYCSKEKQFMSVDHCYIGRAEQNAILERAVRNNSTLFSDGNITAEQIRNDWK